MLVSAFDTRQGIVRAGSTVATVNHKAKKSSDSGQGEHAIQIEAMESQLETSPTGASVPHSCSVSDGQALRDGNTYDVGREAGGDTTSDAQALKRQDAHTKAGRDPTSCVGERSSDSVRTGSNSVKGDDNLQNQSGTDRHSNGKEGYTEREHDGSVNGRRVARTPSDEETRTVVGGQESGGDTGAVNGVLNGESVSCQHDNSETPIEVIVAHDTSASPAADEDDKHVDKIREEENVMPQGQITSGVGGSIDVPTSTIEMPNAQHAKNLELKPCTGSAFGAKEVDGKANSVRTKTNFDRAEAGAIPSTPTKAAVAVSEQKRSDEGSRHVAGIKANAVAVAVARVAAAAAAAPGRQQVPEPDLDETGSSIDCSMHSRWSLPGGGGTGGLHEQGSVWGRGDDGLDQEDDSVGSAEQAPSSEREMEGSDDGKNVRSRVESYDLQHRPVSSKCERESSPSREHDLRLQQSNHKSTSTYPNVSAREKIGTWKDRTSVARVMTGGMCLSLRRNNARFPFGSLPDDQSFWAQSCPSRINCGRSMSYYIDHGRLVPGLSTREDAGHTH